MSSKQREEPVRDDRGVDASGPYLARRIQGRDDAGGDSEIVKVVEERRLAAAESREWQLKC